ncbi:hypothetical protein PY093_09990 [Cytobacillus sp. S13-E01]|uniref:hypothetical protein n=1 Tax=Cytobacillus sp. S13-E01 TaxID=3031326 RepID=UPI0023D7ED87|nr:hypothetical protein [Cytobacillus sp. S13-E01]MDF0727047.1 hypothetical protein [Cytobacillus sp. S13-E01]
MLKNLPHGIKISISRSITSAFEQYMKEIKWDEEKFDLEAFVGQWRKYADTNSSWFEQIDGETKAHPDFHQELADKINDTIKKILSEEPTEAQIHELDRLISEAGGKDIDYSCKAEAKYHIERLKTN